MSKFTVTILNLPKDFSHTSGYIIATPDCGRLWYYGFWEDKEGNRKKWLKTNNIN